MTLQPDQAKREVFASHRPTDSEYRAARTGLLRGALIASTLALCIGAAALGMVPPTPGASELPEQILRQDVVAVPPGVVTASGRNRSACTWVMHSGRLEIRASSVPATRSVTEGAPPR